MADYGGRRNGWGNGGGAAGTEDMLESENNRLSQGLAAKVSTLKSLAMDIDDEAKNQNTYLDGMGDDFTGTEGLLGGTVRRFDAMTGSGRHNRKLMCYLIGFVIAIFILAYFLMGRVTRA